MLKVYRSQSLVTGNRNFDVYEDAFLAIEGDKIRDLGPWKKRPKVKSSQIVDVGFGLITPTLFNLHAHLPMVLFRGIAEDQDLHTWLTQTIFPLEAKFLSPSFVQLGTELALCESIRNGVTYFSNMYLFGAECAKVADRMGVRGIFCQDVSNFDVPDFKNQDDAFAAVRALVRKYKGHPRIQGGISPHSVYGANMETLKKAATLAKEENCGGMIHVSETKREVTESLERFGMSPVEHIRDSGFFDSRFVILAHTVWPTETDFKILQRPNLSVALNVQCNAKLGSGVPPVPRFKKDGIRFTLGTDGAASNNNLDIFEEMNFLGKVHHLTSGDLTGLRCEEIFAAATIRAAEAVGLDDQIGSLEPGKQADFLVVDTRHSHLTPMTNPYSHLIYSVRGADVHSTYVAGKALMRDRKVLVADETKIRKRAQSLWLKMKKTL